MKTEAFFTAVTTIFGACVACNVQPDASKAPNGETHSITGASVPGESFEVPNGRWWLGASFDRKYGFLIGEESCYVKQVLHDGYYVDEPGVYSNVRGNYYDRIDGNIRSNERRLNSPVTQSVRMILKYHKIPNSYDVYQKKQGWALGEGAGILWASLNHDARLGYVHGYMSCKHEYLSEKPGVTVEQAERYVSSIYGLTDRYATDDNGVKPKKVTAGRKIDGIIDRAGGQESSIRQN